MLLLFRIGEARRVSIVFSDDSKIVWVNFSNRIDRIMRRAGDGMTVLGNRRLFRGMISTNQKAVRDRYLILINFREPAEADPAIADGDRVRRARVNEFSEHVR